MSVLSACCAEPDSASSPSRALSTLRKLRTSLTVGSVAPAVLTILACSSQRDKPEANPSFTNSINEEVVDCGGDPMAYRDWIAADSLIVKLQQWQLVGIATFTLDSTIIVGDLEVGESDTSATSWSVPPADPKNLFITNCIITGKVVCNGVVRAPICEFTGTRFGSDVDFRHAVFRGSTSFSDCQFTRGANFAHAAFTEGCQFGGVFGERPAVFFAEEHRKYSTTRLTSRRPCSRM